MSYGSIEHVFYEGLNPDKFEANSKTKLTDQKTLTNVILICYLITCLVVVFSVAIFLIQGILTLNVTPGIGKYFGYVVGINCFLSAIFMFAYCKYFVIVLLVK